MIIYLIPSFLLLLTLPFVYGIQYQPAEYVSYEVLYVNERNTTVHYWIVENMKESTCKPIPGFIIYGCSRHYENPFHDDYIWIRDDAPEFDKFGLTFLEHEKLHIICDCSFHFNDKIEEILMEVENPYEVVIKYKKEIRILDKLYQIYN